jgi:two-component system cell cycle sensor histidine kinase/response regulator CckA
MPQRARPCEGRAPNESSCVPRASSPPHPTPKAPRAVVTGPSDPDAARLSALVDAAPDAIAIVDASWRLSYVNLAFERLSRRDGADLMSRDVWSLWPLLADTQFARDLRELMRDRQPTRLEFDSPRGHCYAVDAMPFGDGMAFFVGDITELKRITEELRQKEAHFRAILNTEPQCVILLGRDGVVMDINPAGFELLEVSSNEEVIGEKFHDFVAPRDRAQIDRLIEAVFDGSSSVIAFEIVGKRGKMRRVEHRAAPLRDATGNITAAISIMSDISERFEVEASLRRHALQHAVVAGLGKLALRDPDVDALTRKAVDAVSETLRMPPAVALDLLRKQGLSSVPRAGSEESSADVQLDPEDADFVRSVAILVTSAMERRRAEDALVERDEQLRQAQKMEAIGQLAGGVAHDFNNLLTVINVHTDLLLQQFQPDMPLRHDVEEIARAASRAASLTRQLLTFSRKQVVQPQVLDLARVVAGVEPMLQRLIGEDIDFEASVSPEIAPVLADEGEIEQVLINLVVNARDAMPQGGRLTMAIANVDADAALCARHPSLRPGAYVQLTVSDSGVGMTAETMARAFEPFFTTKEPGRGTGLGLATVYGIVKQSGGTITVESTPALGTTFSIYLPVASGSPEPGVVAGVRRTGSGGEVVLLAEDEDSVRRLAKRVLESQGYTVLEAINGTDALRLAADYAGVIDLLLSDVVMPEVGGRLLAERLSAMRPDVEVLFMSGYTDDEILRRGLLERGQRLLQKPFTATALAHEVRSLLDAKRHRRSTAHVNARTD